MAKNQFLNWEKFKTAKNAILRKKRIYLISDWTFFKLSGPLFNYWFDRIFRKNVLFILFFQDIAILNFFFDTPIITEITVELRTNVFDMISAVGGTLGLFTGISVITIGNTQCSKIRKKCAISKVQKSIISIFKNGKKSIFA